MLPCALMPRRIIFFFAGGPRPQVVQADIGAALMGLEVGSVDLAVAADVLCYLGDLDRVFRAAAQVQTF